MIKGFAYIVIADNTAGQINHYFAEIGPRTVYLLYSNNRRYYCCSGREIDASQKLGLADETCYTVCYHSLYHNITQVNE